MENQQHREMSFRAGRVRFGALPEEYKYQASTYHEQALPRQASLMTRPQSVCLELKIITGPVYFGILGAEFAPDETNQLTVRVGILNVDEDKIIGLTAGLPETFARAVFDEALLTVPNAPYMGSGVLTFNHAAWHLVDSNARIFRVLAQSVVQLLNPQLIQAAKETVYELVMENWRRI